MTTALERFQQNVSNFRYDPAGIQGAIIDLIQESTDGGLTIVDPTNPLVQIAEAQATCISAFMVQDKTLNRIQYPFSAQEVMDLYPHMSDKDYVDRFAVPASTKMMLFFDKDQLIEKLVVDPDTPSIRKIIIPRNTYIEVADTTFSIQYPIEIRQMAHGGLQIVWDVSQTSPLKALTTNIIEWQIIKADNGQEFVAFEFEVDQFSIASRSVPVNNSTGVTASIEFTGQYYYTRVWIDHGEDANPRYEELKTTYTDEIYDPKVITAVLKVGDGVLKMKIPQIYLSLGLLDKTIRVDVYQTDGQINVDLSNYPKEQFIATFKALDKNEENIFVSPLKSFRNLFAYSTKLVTGGTSEMSFEDLRLRVIKNAIGSPNLPITNAQIEASLNRVGYSVVKNIDNITNRQFLAARSMPTPINSELITAAAAGIGVLSTRIADAVLLDSVIDNGDIVTITPNTLLKIRKGILELVPTSEVNYVKALPSDQQALAVTNGNYFYTPFHYVLDSSSIEFVLRPYYLDSPEIKFKNFVAENDTTLLQVSTNEYAIARTADGYKLITKTRSSDAFKDLDDSTVFVQLAFTAPGEVDRAYLMGTLLGRTTDNERVYEFNLPTNYSIDSKHRIAMLGWKMYDDSERIVDMLLTQKFDVLYATSAPMPSDWRLSDIDSKLGAFLLPAGSRGITHEQFNIELGRYLETLWARSRTAVSEAQYERWTIDVPATYAKDVYENWPGTDSAIKIENGNLMVNKTHSAGDAVLDSEGNPVYKYRVGDVKLDGELNPIVKQDRDTYRQLDFLIIEGSYYFATNQVAIDYRKTLVEQLVSWITEELTAVDDTLLERTDIFFYPITTIGNVDVIFGSGLTTTLNGGQYFQVTLYVDDTVFENTQLQATINRKTVETIGRYLQEKRVVSMSEVVDLLREQYKDDVISFEIKGLGGTSNLNVVTMVDDSQRLSIRKRLVARNDDTLALQEDVTVEFVRHKPKNLLAV